MRLTVFIPTYNGKSKVRRLLEGLKEQTDSAFETHVLIDGSTDGTDTLSSEFPMFRFHSFANHGRAGIRNMAMQLSDDELILFLDHDMLPEADLIERHKTFHREHPDSIVCGNGFRDRRNASGLFSQYLVHTENRWIKSHPVSFRVTADDFVFTACNLSMPAVLFKRLSGFNSLLKDGEDFEFGMRALKAGVPVHYDRSLRAWHDDWPTLTQYIQRNSEYLAGKKVLVKMNPDFEPFLRVNSGERSHNRFKQFVQQILGSAAMKNSFLFRILPVQLKFLAFRSAIYQFSKA